MIPHNFSNFANRKINAAKINYLRVMKFDLNLDPKNPNPGKYPPQLSTRE